jgi:hypothetical protein
LFLDYEGKKIKNIVSALFSTDAKFQFGIMFCIVKLIRVLCDQSSIFSAHQIPFWQLRIPVYVHYTHMA